MVAERADALPALAEIFREHGYEGASLALISRATGLGKGSLYHFFPGGKAEMAAAVLAEIEAWFTTHIFAPLLNAEDPARAIATTLDAVASYFRSGRRVCLVGALALGDTRDRFAIAIAGYFTRWIAALAAALERAGHPPQAANTLAETAIVTIQGAITLTRALDRPDIFERTIATLKHELGVHP